MSDLEFTSLSAGELVDRMRTGTYTDGGAHNRPNEIDRAWQWSPRSDATHPDGLPATISVHRSVLDDIESGTQFPGNPRIDGEPDRFYRFGDSHPSFGGRTLDIAGVAFRVSQYDPHTQMYLATRVD